MVQSYKELIAAGILGQVDKTGIAVFQNIIYQFLYDPEDDQLVLGLKSFPVVVKAGAGIHAAGAADLLEKIIYSRFEPKVLEGWRHQAVGDIADQLDGIIDDRFGIVDTLQLGCLIQVDQVLIQI